jgi:hypothetical protein
MQCPAGRAKKAHETDQRKPRTFQARVNTLADHLAEMSTESKPSVYCAALYTLY